MTKQSFRSWAAVTAVALGTFTLVTNEFLPVGMLPEMARDLHVSVGIAGTMMTVPGVVAAVAAPTLSVAAGRIDRRIFLLAMTVLFTIADILGAVSPNFPVMLIARVLLGLGIGGFWAIGATIGGRLVGTGGAPRATALIFSGVSIASVIGVPAGAFVGATWGWRVAFAATAGLGIVALIGQLVLLPKLGVDTPVTARQLASVLKGRNARIGLVATLLLVIGQFTAYTYIAPFLEKTNGTSASTVSALLLVYGAAGIIGNFTIGTVLRRHLRGGVLTLAILIGLSAVALPLLGITTPAVAVVLAVWGAAYGAVPLALQTWVFTSDGVQTEGGSALFISAFQISVAGGSLLGGFLVDHLPVQAAMFTGTLLAAAAAITLLRGRNRSPEAPSTLLDHARTSTH